MLRFILVRPGSTEIAEQGRIQGCLDVPLSDSGENQVRSTVQALEAEDVDAIYSGPCVAAQQTAQLIATHLESKTKVVDLLRNLDLGLWNGRRIDELKASQPKVYKQWQEHPETVCPPGGETLEDAQNRLRKALLKIVRRRKEGTFVLVLMEPLASIASSLLRSTEIGDLWKAEQICGCHESIEIESQKIAVELIQA
jgi:broad specificity phosphatase PhoE